MSCLNGYIYVPFWKTETINNTKNGTAVPLHAPHDVADQLVKTVDSTPGEEVEHQVDFMEVAPVDYDFMPQPAGVDINFVESLRSFLSRPYPIFSATWTGDNAREFLIADIDPLESYLNIPVVFGKLQGFEYLRAGLKIEIRINGTRFHYGQLVAGFLPLSNLKIYDSSQRSAGGLTMFPGVVLDPGPSEVGIFELPYVHPHHFMRLTSDSAIDIANRSLGTLQIKVLVPLRVVSQTTVPSVTFTVYASLVNPVLNGFTAATTPVPLLLQEQSGDSATRFVPEAMNFLATDINDVSIRGGMQGDNRVDQDEQYIGASRRDMLFSTIFEKPNFISHELWSSGNIPGETIDTFTVRPNQAGDLPSHFLYQLSRMNRFWRGTLRYHTRFVASGFHSGRAIISWEPNLTATINTISISNRLHMVVDLQQTTDVFFSIPYMQPRPWLPFNAGNGTIRISILNSLSTPSGEPTDVNVLTWMYGGEDLEFAMPYVQLQAGVLSDQSQILEEQCLTQPLTSPLFNNLLGSHSVPGKMVMGEKLSSVSQLLQKFATFSNDTGVVMNRQYCVFTNSALNGPVSSSHIAFLSRMFVLMRGSFRYAPIAYTSAVQTTPTTEYTVGPSILGEIGTVPLYGNLVVRTTTPNAMLEVPWYSDEIFALTDSPNSNMILPAAIADSRASASIYCFAAAGKDFMLAYLVPPPRGL